jgi:tol-pal system protein YbgF
MRTRANRVNGQLLVLALALFGASGCATKSDMRTLQSEIRMLQLRQDSVLMQIQQQNRLLLDSVRTSMALTVDSRGTTANQLRQFDQNVTQLGQLVGQVMGSLNRIEQRLTTLEQRPAAAPAGGGSSAAPAGGTSGSSGAGGATAEEYYETGMQMMSSRSFATARMAFQQLVQEFPQHERAPDAQFQLGQAFYHEGQFQEAYAALELVPAQWPQSARAPAALFRAGAIAEERRGFVKARGYYQQIVDKYGRSEEAGPARQKLRTLPR